MVVGGDDWHDGFSAMVAVSGLMAVRFRVCMCLCEIKTHKEREKDTLHVICPRDLTLGTSLRERVRISKLEFK